MGASLDSESNQLADRTGKLKLSLKISPQQLEDLQTIVQERSNFKNQHLCTIERLVNQDDKTPSIFCQNFSQVIIEYQQYDFLLSDSLKGQPLAQIEIQKIIFSVCSALIFLHQKKYSHGDIQPKLICNSRGDWKLLDNYFIKGGVSAYEKVLEGEQGFISPSQMEKIRHGFVRQSPPIQESDEVFGLGMTCLELMSGKKSSLCYKESYIRFNDKNFSQSINIAQTSYPQYFSTLVLAMVNMNQQKRISIKDIMQQPFINRHSKKFSLRNPQKP